MNNHNTKLTRKQQLFVKFYLKTSNATQAVMMAGYKTANDNTAAVIGYENLSKPAIKKAIELGGLKPAQTEWLKARTAQLGYTYLIQAANGLTKIGSTTNIERRFKELNTSSPIELTLTHTLKSKEFKKVELELHRVYKGKRVRGEWFKLLPSDIQEIEKQYGFDR